MFFEYLSIENEAWLRVKGTDQQCAATLSIIFPLFYIFPLE